MSKRVWLANGIEGRHVLMGLIAFFGVMLLANGIFVYLAVATFSGGDTADPYRKGLHYNETLQAAERQEERGWRTGVEYDDKTGQLTLSFLDKEAHPIAGLHIDAMMSRPATDRQDRSIGFRQAGEGLYAADVELDAGLWVISVEANEPGEVREPPYRIKRRLFVADQP
jgi:nitrogen fixation protein FixH